MTGEGRINASRDWLRAMQRTAAAVAQRSRTFARMLEEQAGAFGDHTAVIDPVGGMTYGQLSAQANRYAGFVVQNGIRAGDCVALLMPNGGDYIAAWSGISATGAVAALVNVNLRGKSLAHSLSVAAARAVIVADSLLEAYLSALPYLDSPPALWVRGDRAPGAPSLDQALAQLDGSPIRDASGGRVTLDDRALLIFTSGTTGLPKAAKVSHARIIEWSAWFAGLLDTQPHDRMYDCLPLYHSVGGIVAPGSVLASGGSVLIREKFSARQFWDDVVDHDCTLFQYIGDLCRYLVSAPPHPRERTHRLRICCGNGLNREVWTRFQRRFAIPRVLEFYAATEGSFSLYNVEGKPGAIGRLTGMMARRPPLELVRFNAESGLPARGEDGLCIRCGDDEPGEALGRLGAGRESHRFEGYTSEAESERKVVRDVLAPADRWLRTGDLMRRDAEGYYYFVDRLGDTFRWKGENVSTLEVGNALSDYPGIVNATVYGVEVPGHDGRAGMAAIETDDSFKIAGLYRHLCDVLPVYAVPVFVRIVSAIATTETFKPRRQGLAGEGFDPGAVRDRLYVADPRATAYVALTTERYARLAAAGVATL